MTLVKNFENFIKEQITLLKFNDIKVEFNNPAIITDNPSMYVDFISNKYYGRITIWESGFCDLEIIDCNIGQNILNEHIEKCYVENFRENFSKFFKFFMPCDNLIR